MKINKAELKTSAYSENDFPPWDMPEVSFIGRSNVGKSSLLNTLIGRKNLARISSTPGKTRGLYFYALNDKLCFVDLPGYGYAKVSKKERERWAPIIEDYLATRSNLRGCLHLIDCRHQPTEDDRLMSEWLRAHTIPTITVATKSDKMSRSVMLRQLKVIRTGLGLFDEDLLLPFSSRTGAGRDDLWKAIMNVI
ncbi:MAG: ribosome biogenesis GTP-binding protein YihA/YsxC [Dethiobacteria bacterium]|nr:ribosome biogenesis GTP-binding protein YihA/YsxC [Bacillota bacterium]MDW7728477.1 ribosome biogenesis GTP-binding protein YihA/YsxC [Bacillota bacterium]